MSVRERMKFFQGGHSHKHDDNNHGYNRASDEEDSIESDSDSDLVLIDKPAHSKHHVKRNISLLIQELTNRNH